MEYTLLGNTGMRVSRVCLGCMGFGDAARGMHKWVLDEAHSREILAKALDAGINFFDTAIAYQGGTSEEYVGRAIRDFVRREDVVLATKFPSRTQEEIQAGIDGRNHVKNMLDASLKHLNTDYIDLYICHMWDYHTPIEEILQGLNDAVRAGKVRHIGISNCFAWQLCKANEIARREGWPMFESIQGHYNLIFREEEREMIPYCQSENIAVTPYSALASGRLARISDDTKRMREDAYAHSKYDATADQDAVIIGRVNEIAKAREVSMTQIALAWLIQKGAVPVCGATKLHHIEDMEKATALRLSEQEMHYLEEMYAPHNLVGVMAQNH